MLPANPVLGVEFQSGSDGLVFRAVLSIRAVLSASRRTIHGDWLPVPNSGLRSMNDLPQRIGIEQAKLLLEWVESVR